MKINWDTITGPTVLINRHRAQHNIRTMQEKANAAGVALRPHFKTHQSNFIGKWFGAPESTPIAVSSLTMAQQFADAGWTDIHIAIPLNPRELSALNSLASRVSLTLTIEHEDALAVINNITHALKVMVEIDTGYGRTGMHWQQHDRIRSLLDALQALPKVQRIGLMVHSGHSYNATGDAAIQAVHQESSARLKELIDMMAWHVSPLWVSTGDTPTCSRMDSFPMANEIRPGNYVFYDLQQKTIGACDWQNIALAMACPVIARYPERNEVVVHGGAVHFGKDWVDTTKPDGASERIFGQVMHNTANGWGAPITDAVVISLSQEHGKLRLPAAMVRELKLGDLVIIVPPHSCLTMNAAAATEKFICFDD